MKFGRKGFCLRRHRHHSASPSGLPLVVEEFPGLRGICILRSGLRHLLLRQQGTAPFQRLRLVLFGQAGQEENARTKAQLSEFTSLPK